MSKISEKVGKIIVHKRIFCQTNRRKKKNIFCYVMGFVVQNYRDKHRLRKKKMKINQETKHIQNDDDDRTEQNNTKTKN